MALLRIDGVDGSHSRHQSAKAVAVERRHAKRGAIQMQVITIGLDLAKSVLQVHGVDAAGQVVVRKALRRSQVLSFFAGLPGCLVGMEACGTAHYWGRELSRLGHQVRLMPPSYVKAYVRRGKTDAADAEAICEAVGRPNMRFVPVKSEAQQAVLMLHRSRELLLRQRGMTANALRAHLAELGHVTAQGLSKLEELAAQVLAKPAADQQPEPGHQRHVCAALSPHVLLALGLLVEQLEGLKLRIRALEIELMAWHRSNDDSRRLETIPGIGFLTATALAATVSNISQFGSGRQFAAWLGLTPKPHSSGGKQRLGKVSKQGNRYLRALLVVGAGAVIRFSKRNATPSAAFANKLLARKPTRLVSVALANKTARIAWAVLARKQAYRSDHATMTIAAPAGI
jgi:transposase